MAQSDEPLTALAKAMDAGGGIHSAAELAFMLGVPCNPAFRKFLADYTKKGLLRRMVTMESLFYANLVRTQV